MQITKPRFYNERHYETYIAIFASIITFLTYASVYAFRKPFTVASYNTAPHIFGLGYKDALVITHIIIVCGFLIAGISSWMFINHYSPSFVGMTLVGLGLYLGYIPFNCILFERMIATFKKGGNVGFLMYIADSFGYMRSVSVIIGKSVLSNKLPWATVYSHGVMYLSVVGVVGTFMALHYFNRKYKRDNNTEVEPRHFILNPLEVSKKEILN